jgi:hypothetical protein
MSTKQAMKTTPAAIAAMTSEDRSKAATAERAAVRRAEADGKRKPPTPVSNWIEAHADEHKTGKTAGRTASAGARVGAGPRLPEAERVALFNAAVKAGANTMAGVKKHIRSKGKPCSGKWIRPLLVEAAKKGLLAEPVRKAPAKTTAKKAPAKKAGPKTFRGPISKASQTRGAGKKAPAKTVAARRHSAPSRRVTKRTTAKRGR